MTVIISGARFHCNYDAGSDILQATTGANTTTYLNGVAQIGEFGAQTSYYLVDGVGSVRQVVDQNASIVFARWYDPFGQIIKQNGGGDALYGYLGAQFDRLSGLMYINGAYYDPVTGRFLSPVGDGQNPYVPLGGAALAPILILALLGRRKKGKIWTGWLVIALMMSVGLSVAACGGQPTPAPTPAPGTFPTRIPSSWPPIGEEPFRLPDFVQSPYKTDPQIVLGSTIRFEIEPFGALTCPPQGSNPQSNISTGTYMGNGHIYTHNHFKFSINKDMAAVVNIQKSDGTTIYGDNTPGNGGLPLKNYASEGRGNSDIQLAATPADTILQQNGVGPAKRGDPSQLIVLSDKSVVSVPAYNGNRYDVVNLLYVQDVSAEIGEPAGLFATNSPSPETEDTVIHTGDSGGGLWFRGSVVGNSWTVGYYGWEVKQPGGTTSALGFGELRAALIPSKFTFSP